LTGLILLTGRVELNPVFGHEVFPVLASASKVGCNMFAPLVFTRCHRSVYTLCQ